MNEREIIQEINAGDTDQYGLLVERYQVGLIIQCDRLVGDRDEAEDIAQKAFIKAYEKLLDFDSDKARYSTWLYRIATNMALDLLKAQKRAVPTDMELKGKILEAITGGTELNIVLERDFGIKSAGSKNGLYGLATNDLVTREAAYVQGLAFALAAFLHPEYYTS